MCPRLIDLRCVDREIVMPSPHEWLSDHWGIRNPTVARMRMRSLQYSYTIGGGVYTHSQKKSKTKSNLLVFLVMVFLLLCC